MDRERPDPDALLARVAAEEAAERGGQLKVFLGAAPGVGKTYAMLNAARELRRRGVDVVVGIVETHGRAETEALLEGLEVLPRQRLGYQSRTFEELDLDGLLARRPKVALVDELAHSNVPGARHERRWQDVAELLDAGIDVYSTLNVQHVESLNDIVEQITGVKVRETVPDAFLDRLTDVILVDLPPRELIERLRQGKVYVPERAQAALQAFFSPSNLAALRELAMQAAADRVDADLREHLAARGATAGLGIRRRVLVAVDGHEGTEYLVRAGRRFAERRQAPWTAVHVDSGSRRTDPAALHAGFQLAQRLGAQTAVLRGSNVVDELLAYANRHGVSSILIGRTRERPLARLLNRTVSQQLLRRGAGFELTLVATPEARRRARQLLRAGAPRSRARELALAAAAVAAAVVAGLPLRGALPVGSLALLFVCAVLAVAVRTSTSAALFAAALSALAYNFFFTEPRLTFQMSSPADVVAVAAFLVAALAVGQLAGRQRDQVVRLRTANEHARALQALGERLASAADEEQVARAACESLAEALGADCLVLLRGRADAGTLRRAAARPANVELGANDLAAADWVAAHAQPAGRFTNTLAGSPWWFSPLVVEEGCLGAIGVRFPEGVTRLAAEQRDLAQAIVHQVSQAVERTRLVANLESARVEGETERLRTALLSSVSHDLRSPLAAVIGAAGSLSAYGDAMSEADRAALVDSIRSEGERLDRYIQNLLDMTRLGSGPMKLQRDWVGLDEILDSAAGRLRKLFPETAVETDLEPGLPPLFVHAALVEQALFNILENAAKFSPAGAPVRVRARRGEGQLELEVTDRGPGIPEAERHRIFDLFYSAARGDRAPRGSGLGLTIVRGMIGAHGGKVEALPGPEGAGTTIRIRLPLATPPETAGDAET
jgi:two-component system sensor histidine kinase KdpD